MKKLLSLLLFILPLIGLTQNVSSEVGSQTGDLKEFAKTYCTVSFSQNMSGTIRVYTDDRSWLFTDENGKKMKFRTSTHILNHMNEEGWEFIYAYTDTLIYYIFKRKEDTKK